VRRLAVGALVSAAVLGMAAFAIAQITNGVPSANFRAGSPADLLAGGWDKQVLASGAQPLENPTGVFRWYGYLDDATASANNTGCTPAFVAQASGLRTKTEPDQNTYVVTTSNPGGPTASYDYGRHFLIQGHEVFSNTGGGVGQTNSAYITRINLDVPVHDVHHITRLGLTAGADNCSSGMASLDGSTYDPFTGQMLFTGEAGGSSASSIAYGGVYATPLTWSSTTPPTVEHTSLQGAFGHAGYEGIQVDDQGNLLIAEDTGGSTVANGVKKANSFIFRFLPTNPSDLTAGKLQALQVTVDGTPLTFANQDPIAGTPDKRLYSGDSFSGSWITIHDTGLDGTANFDANALAKTANATPFKRPENLRFVPGTGFKSFVYTVTGDTSATAIDNQTPPGQTWADRGAAGGVMRVDMPSSGAGTATVRTIIPGTTEQNSFDSITFLDKDTLLVGEDRGDALHAQYNALDSTWSFDLTQPFAKQPETAERLIAQGRDPESTDDVNKKEATPPVADQNDGDNEVTGVLVSNGISSVSSVFGTEDPGKQAGAKAFYTGQHGANATYMLVPPGPDSSRTPPAADGPPGPPGPAGPPGQNGDNGQNGQNGAGGAPGPQGNPGASGPQGPQGAAGPQGQAGRNGLTILCRQSGKKVTCSTAKTSRKVKASTTARLMRGNLVYAKGTLRSMHTVRRVKRGFSYSLLIGKGRSTQRLWVLVR
jgi:Collagen triple helix repeat (20 copies)